MSSDFPHGITLERKEGLRMDMGPVNCQLLRLLSEKHNDSLYERTAVFESRRLDTEEAVILKLRYQGSTSNYPERDRPIFVQKATRDFENECKALKECESSGHTPKFIHSEGLQQDGTDVFPGGYLHALVMSMVPGLPVTKIFESLAQDDLAVIRKQLTKTLEHMRLTGFLYAQADTAQIFYDKDHRTMYLTGLARADEVEPNDIEPITQDSMEVTAFGLGWS